MLLNLLLLAPLFVGTSPAHARFLPLDEQDKSQSAKAAAVDIPTATFCEVLNKPHLYFDKTVRLEATYRVGYETAYLIDEPCVLSHRVMIGVSFEYPEASEREIIRKDVDKIMSGAYGNGRARVMVVGTLRNKPDRTGFGGYRYRFDISRFEVISREQVFHTIIDYEGRLVEGQVYRGIVRGNQHYVLSLKPGLNVPIGHAVRIEWTNVGDFRKLKRLRDSSREQRLVFKVTSDEIKQMTERRWNRTVQCQIISVEE